MAKLTKVQKHYIRTQAGKVPDEEIAADVGVTVARVRQELREAAEEAKPAPRPPALDRFASVSPSTGKAQEGVAVMTPQRSMQDDADGGTSPFGTAQVSEAVRDFVRRNMDSMTPEKLAAETGLPPFQVRMVTDQLRGVDQGRREFYDRNKTHLHKIRPDEPFK